MSKPLDKPKHVTDVSKFSRQILLFQLTHACSATVRCHAKGRLFVVSLAYSVIFTATTNKSREKLQ